MEVYRCLDCMEEMEKNFERCPHCGFDISGYTQPPNTLKINTILYGKYLIGRVLGQGGFGITYVGYDLNLGLKVAVKEYYPGGLAFREEGSNKVQWSFGSIEYQNYRNGIERFLTEARKMAKLDGVAGIVRVRDSFEENQTAYIVMDFAEGVSLRQYLKQSGRRRWQSAVQLLLPIMDSMDLMHQKGMVHRDISPDNLMVQMDGKNPKVMLLDFGASIDLGQHTERMESVVKKGFSAPEQYEENGNIGSWSDVYAMAAVLYNCITGRELPEAMERIVNQSSVRMDAVGSKKVSAVLNNALSLRPEERIQTMGELRETLIKLLPTDRKRVKKIAVAAAALAAAAVSIGIYDARPWAPHVEALGTSNSNLLCGSNYAVFEEKRERYEYYAEGQHLWISPYEYNEAEARFYRGDDRIVLERNSGYINIGKDSIYFICEEGEENEKEYFLMKMDFDGENVGEIMSAGYFRSLQYIQSSDGKEYLYYLKGDKEAAGIDQLCTLCRYDLKKAAEEELLGEGAYWYNLDEKYIYYNTNASGVLTDKTILKRAYLDGERSDVLNDKDYVLTGYIEDGTTYLFSFDREQMLVCDTNGKIRENPLEDVSEQIYNSCSVYGDGWIYYSPNESGEIRRIRIDGTGDEVIYTGENILNMSYSQYWLLVYTGVMKEDGEYRIDQTFMIYAGGGDPYFLGVEETADGLLYCESGEGEITVTGYSGNESYVVIPWEFEKGRWNGQIGEGFPKDVETYVRIRSSELYYEKTSDGTGIILTGYTGEVTGEWSRLAIPERIEGLPVEEVGESFMRGNETIEGIVFPEGLVNIQDCAFADCTSLKQVELPDSLVAIQYAAFSNTAIRDLTIPSGLTVLYPKAFTDIENIMVDEGNEYFSVEEGVLYQEDSILKKVLTGKTGDFVIPQSIETIASYAFTGSQITSAIIPGNVSSVYTYAFYHAQKLQKVILSEGVTQINSGAFEGCVSLSSVIFPKSMLKIKADAFADCSGLRDVIVSSDCQIEEGAFEPSVQIHYYDEKE